MNEEWVSVAPILTHRRVGRTRRIPRYSARRGAHVWVMVAVYVQHPERWTPTDTPILDVENLGYLDGPLCYHCRIPYTDMAKETRCPGET